MEMVRMHPHEYWQANLRDCLVTALSWGIPREAVIWI